MKRLVRIVVFLIVLVLPVTVSGGIGGMLKMNEMMGDIENRPEGFTSDMITPSEYDPDKPTVGVVLGSDNSEILDVLIPYELFSATGKYNVYTVSPTNNLTTLSGGLDIIPHYSFEELNELVGGDLDVLVVPAIFYTANVEYDSVREYIKGHSGSQTTILSICAGAENLADAGLLDYVPATTHFGDMVKLKMMYRDVDWVKGKRYVVYDNVVTTAGITSGIDGSLYVISQMFGEETAKSVAEELNYHDLQYVNDPTMEHFGLGLPDVIALLNGGYHWITNKDGVLLYEGMEETALGTIFDAHTISGTTSTRTIGETVSPIKTKNGLFIVPRYTKDTWPSIERMIVTGTNALHDKDKYSSVVEALPEGVELVYLHAKEPERFILEPALEDLAKQTNNPTATFAAKRLEYRADALELEGPRFALGVTLLPIVLLFLSLLLAIILDKRFFRKRWN